MVCRRAFAKFQHVLKVIRFFSFSLLLTMQFIMQKCPLAYFVGCSNGIYLYFIVLRNYPVAFDTERVIAPWRMCKISLTMPWTHRMRLQRDASSFTDGTIVPLCTKKVGDVMTFNTDSRDASFNSLLAIILGTFHTDNMLLIILHE